MDCSFACSTFLQLIRQFKNNTVSAIEIRIPTQIPSIVNIILKTSFISILAFPANTNPGLISILLAVKKGNREEAKDSENRFVGLF